MNETDYHVVKNEHGDYALLPAHWAVPDGWSGPVYSGQRQDCIEFVDSAWVDFDAL